MWGTWITLASIVTSEFGASMSFLIDATDAERSIAKLLSAILVSGTKEEVLDV